MEVIVDGTIEDLLGLNIDMREDGIIHLKQPHIIEEIVKYLKQENNKMPYKSTRKQPSKILHSYKQSEDFEKSSVCRLVMGKLN